MSENTNKKTREWVKTFAIIFLSVLLVLTFFSNTIMNMNLPEISTDNICYGSIKTQVRTSGTVMSVDNYSVTFPVSREIQTVKVRQGDMVNRGDVLFVLAEGDSAELEAAKENYANMKYDYDRLIISSDGASDFADRNRTIAEITEDLNEALAKRDSLSTDIANNESAIAAKEAEISTLEAQINNQEKLIEAKNKEISDLEAEKNAIGYTPSEDEVLIGRDEGVTYEEYVSVAALVDNADLEVETAEKALDEANDKKTALEKELNAIKREYEKKAKEVERLEAELADMPTKEQLESKKNEIQQSDRNIEELERDLKFLKQDFYEATSNFTLEKLYDKYKDKQKAYKKAKAKYEELLASGTATPDEIAIAEQEYEYAADALDEAYDLYQACLTDEKKDALAEEKVLGEAETSLKYALEDNNKLKKEYSELETEYNKRAGIEVEIKVLEEGSKDSGGNVMMGLNALEEKMDAKESEVKAAEDAVSDAEAELNRKEKNKEKVEDSVGKTRNEYKYTKVKEYELNIESKKAELENLEAQLYTYKDDLEEKNEELAELEGEHFESEESLDERIKTLERQLASEKAALEENEKNATEEEKLKQLEITKKKAELDKAAEELKKLEDRATSNEVTAPVSGVIETVNVQVGQKFEANGTLAEISLSERGFRMTATVSQEQAARLRPGLVAEITSWVPYESEIKVTLDSIKSDTANPGSRQKVLEFIIDGGIEPGQNLSIAVGDKNANYDNTVPNTAIREDSNGKYVLVVESKSTAISTRYIARRVPVTVIASDDTRSAITGEFDNYAFVVATSSAPINDGDQVKLNEN